MARWVSITCAACGKDARRADGPLGPAAICHECEAKDAAEKKRRHLAELAALPLAERVALIEEALYDAEVARKQAAQTPPLFGGGGTCLGHGG